MMKGSTSCSSSTSSCSKALISLKNDRFALVQAFLREKGIVRWRLAWAALKGLCFFTLARLIENARHVRRRTLMDALVTDHRQNISLKI